MSMGGTWCYWPDAPFCPRAVIFGSFADFSPPVTPMKKSKHVASSPWHGIIVEPLNLGFRQAVQMPELGRQKCAGCEGGFAPNRGARWQTMTP